MKWIKTLLRDELYHSPAGSWKVDGEQKQLPEPHLSGILSSLQTSKLWGFYALKPGLGPGHALLYFRAVNLEFPPQLHETSLDF